MNVIENNEKANFKLVIILLIIVIIGTLGFCFLIYIDKIIPVKLNVDNYTIIDEDSELCKIDSITESGNNYKIDGSILKDDIKIYELYISVENPKGKVKFYRTNIDVKNKTFLAIIKKNKVKQNSKISIVYMCDDDEFLIKTNNVLGVENE